MLARLVAAGMVTLSLAACESGPAPLPLLSACRAPLVPFTMVELYFGRAIPGGGEVTDAQWADFVATSVTPRFPDGLSVMDVQGQYRGANGVIVRERSKFMQIGVRDPAAAAARIDQVIADYRQRFRQESVFRVERPVCAAL